jgi:2-C-methyl-D-erythritol 4-phosphate cytidylyltransferase
MIKVSQEIKVIEVNGSKTEAKDVILNVHSHSSNGSCIVLEIDGVRYTVANKDIEAAIENAANANYIYWS